MPIINTPKETEKYIDHTELRATASFYDIEKLCKEAEAFNFHSVCVNPYYVAFAKRTLVESDVKVGTVIGFPLGATTKAGKVDAALSVADEGADEIGMVINISALKSNNYDYVEQEIRLVVEAVKETNIQIHAILETCYLTDEEIKLTSEFAMKAGAHIIKTSTGFGSEGARLDHVALIKSVVGDKIGIKAAGGIRNYDIAKAFIEHGAARLGTSSGVAIATGVRGIRPVNM